MDNQEIVKELEILRQNYIKCKNSQKWAARLFFSMFFGGAFLGVFVAQQISKLMGIDDFYLIEVGAMLGFVLAIGLFLRGRKMGKAADEYQSRFRVIYKGHFVEDAIKDMADNLVYDADGGFTKEYMDSLMLVETGRRFGSEDYMKGSYQGIPFQQSDVIVLGKGSKHDITFFRGQVVSIENLPQRVMHVQIYTKNFTHRGFTPEQLHHIRTEDVGFNKIFQVWSEDAAEALYILTPPLMEKFKELSKKYANVGIHFWGNQIAFGFEYLDGTTSFEADMDKMVGIEQERDRMRAYMQEILDLIKLLQLVEE